MQIGGYKLDTATLKVDPTGPRHPMVALDLRALPAGTSPLPHAWQEFYFTMERDAARRLAEELLALTEE